MKTYPITTPAALLLFYDAAKHDTQRQSLMRLSELWKAGKLEDAMFRLEIGKKCSEVVSYEGKSRRVVANIYTAAAKDIAKELEKV